MMSLPVTCRSSLVAYDQSESSIREAGEAERAPGESIISAAENGGLNRLCS